MNGRIRASERVVALTGSDQVLVDTAPDRVGLLFLPPTQGVVTLTPRSGGTEYQGLQLRAGDAPVELWAEYHGDLVRLTWHALLSSEVALNDAPISDFWAINANAVNGIATATRAAEAGKIHLIDGVDFSLSSSVTGDLGRVLDGVAVLHRYQVATQLSVNFTRPLQGTRSGAVSADLAAGGVGVTGDVNLRGRSVPAASIMVVESFGY